jgi:hypothetical protein
MKDVVKKQNTELTTNINFETDAEAGFEQTDSKDFKMPFLRIIQKGSPEKDDADPKYIEGAKEGQLLNVRTKMLYDEVNVVPVFYLKKYVEYIPRESGGGFQADYDLEDPIVKKMISNCSGQKNRGHYILSNGNELIRCGYFPCLQITEYGIDQIIICVKSTGFTFAQDFLAIMRSHKMQRDNGVYFTPSFFSYNYTLGTKPCSKKTYNWKGWNVLNYELLNDVNIYNMAKELYNRLKSENLSVDMGEEEVPKKQDTNNFEDNNDDLPFN